MRIRQRRIVAVIGIVVGFLAAGVLPAQAAPAGSAGTVLPRVGGGAAESASVAAGDPTTSPAPARRVWVSVGEVHDCPTGYACATPSWGSNGGWEFQFYNYGTYSLSNFTGDSGSISNSQTGNAGMRILDQNGKVIRCQWAGTADYVNWDPVWYITLSPTPC